MIIKEYFTDGLLQVAIVLSLLRTDLNNYFNSAHYSAQTSSELQEILLGPLSGYTQARFHTHNYWSDGIRGGYMHPKSIGDVDLIFRDLHDLGRYRRFDGVDTNINTWLVSNLDASGDGAGEPSREGSVPTNNDVVVDGSASETVPNVTAASVNVEDNFGSELSKEV